MLESFALKPVQALCATHAAVSSRLYMLRESRPQTREWLKALLLNSLLFIAFAALYFIPGGGQALLLIQSLLFGLPFLLTFMILSALQQFIVPRPPTSGLRWTLISLGCGIAGIAVVLLLLWLITTLLAGGTAQGALTVALCAAAFGAVVGAGQWLVIANRLRIHAWWIAISALGYVLAALLLMRILPSIA